ncbi:hypothetical protein Nepgr_007655 [Nepenthes gracilis]|uniref:Uncharacterized protein n=1 Tax=Nepenthes gracilis TaxID=150966 RepID=A0AAD3S7A2_NEPGR|nr:hypothetical protein Nepgr_007655 [Nepenthes gracilis]
MGYLVCGLFSASLRYVDLIPSRSSLVHGSHLRLEAHSWNRKGSLLFWRNRPIDVISRKTLDREDPKLEDPSEASSSIMPHTGRQVTAWPPGYHPHLPFELLNLPETPSRLTPDSRQPLASAMMAHD